MNVLIEVNYGDKVTVSGRELHAKLEIKTPYKQWFDRMAEYGFAENEDYLLVTQKCATNNPKNPWTEITDHEITLDMAKQICMIQRTEVGKKFREYFLDIERKWNSPDQVIARGLVIAEKTIERLKQSTAQLEAKIEQDAPLVTFAQSVANADNLILIRDLAKNLTQAGFKIGERRLFEKLREDGYLIKGNSQDRNMPTQRAIEQGLFRVVERTSTSDQNTYVSRTTKVTGKGQTYFAEKYASKSAVMV